ncbi:hypothetical protein P3W85_41170, partial [Cupriavidus basilensis]
PAQSPGGPITGLLTGLLQASRDTLRRIGGGVPGKEALTRQLRAARQGVHAGPAPASGYRLQLTCADTPLTPATARFTATATVVQGDGTDITATLAPSAWRWRRASGLSMRAGHGAVTVDMEGSARTVCVCPLGISLSLSGTSRAACRALAAEIEVVVLLGNGERLSQRLEAGLAELE